MRRERISNLLSENMALWKVYGNHILEYLIKKSCKRDKREVHKKLLDEDIVKISKNYQELSDEINDMMDITEATEKEVIKLTGEKIAK